MSIRKTLPVDPFANVLQKLKDIGVIDALGDTMDQP